MRTMVVTASTMALTAHWLQRQQAVPRHAAAPDALKVHAAWQSRSRFATGSTSLKVTVSDGCLRTFSRRGGGRLHAVAEATASISDDEVYKAFSKLQNGSDIRGVAIAVPENPVTLQPASAAYIARGFVDWLAERTGKPADQLRVSVGRDPRLSGPALAAALAAGLASKGVAVTDFGPATTPAMFMSCILEGHQYDGAIMITASHLPFHRNGFKFFTAEGGAEKADIAAVLKGAAAQAAAAGVSPADEQALAADVLQTALRAEPTLIGQDEFMPVYAAHLRGIIKRGVDDQEDYEHPLRGFHIVVDAGNGGGGYFAYDVLQPLGANIEGSQFLDGDGRFPNHIPNPENAEAMAAGCEMVKRSGADLGIVFDTDVDRSAVVAANGEPINSNRYIGLMSYIALREHPGTTIVTDSVTSNGLSDFIKGLGGRHFRFQRGYKNVINKGIALAKEGVDCQLMMETSGHGAMQENYYLDDGAYSAVRCVIELVRTAKEGGGRDITALLRDLKEATESREYRLKVSGTDDVRGGMQAVLDCFHDWLEAGAGGASNWSVEPENHEGWRVSIDEGEGRRGWALLRASLHDPLLVINIESEVEGGARATAAQLMKFFMVSCAQGVEIDIAQLALGAGKDGPSEGR